MHVMEGDCEKSSGCLTAEGAPELAKPVETTDAKTPVEANLTNGDHQEEEEEEEEEENKIDAKEEPKIEEKPIKEEKETNDAFKEDEELNTKENNVEKTPSETDPSQTENEEQHVSSKPPSPVVTLTEKEIKEEPVPLLEEDDRNSISSSHVSQSEGERRKRSIEREGEGEVSSGSESESGRKKPRTEHEAEQTSIEPSFAPQNYIDDDRERMIQDFVADCTQTPDDLEQTAEKLQKEVETLAELARAKELEWNAILRVRKLKEEMLERVLRRKRITGLDDPLVQKHMDTANLHKNLRNQGNQNHLMMVPIVSSSPGLMHSRGPPPPRNMPDFSRMQRPILPKPYPGMVDPGIIREGRNGPILDVKSIIADYRARHPENVPRRGRRLRSEGGLRLPPPHPASLISMANLALGSGSRVRTAVPEVPYNLSQDHTHPSSTDLSRNSLDTYKEVVSHFSKMSTPGMAKGAPPPYPEVTLHPVTRPNSPPTSSLLHGILTKATPSPTNRAATFSPTLARLLTAPERPSNPGPPPHFRPQPTPRVSLADILTSSKKVNFSPKEIKQISQNSKNDNEVKKLKTYKSRNEITITPVAGSPVVKPKEDVVLLDDDDAESGDRLVIDEGAETDDALQCQGCRQKSAQFVCAGCGNQWYCSRECQVTAWEEHSEVCSG